MDRFLRQYLGSPRACLGFAILFTLGAASATAPAGEIPPGSSNPPWVWEVQAPNGPTIWIAGVLHMNAPSDADVFRFYLPFYSQASCIYFEASPASWNSFEARRWLGMRGLLHDGRSLRDRIGVGTWDRLQVALKTQPGELAMISRMEPWFAAVTLTQNQYRQAGLTSDDSLEAFLRHLAVADRKPVGALENPEDEITALADASQVDQEAMLNASLGQDVGVIQKLDSAWRAGDRTGLQAALESDNLRLTGNIHRRLIEVRNQRWLSKLKIISHRGQSAFVIVGVEHMVDPVAALPILLERAGFRVQSEAD